MNKAQRKTLQAAVDAIDLGLFTDEAALSDIPAMKAKFEAAVSNLESVTTDIGSEERDKFDNMPEGLQNSETGQRIEEAADTLENLDFPDVENSDFDTEEGRLALQGDLETLIDELEELL